MSLFEKLKNAPTSNIIKYLFVEAINTNILSTKYGRGNFIRS